MLRIRYSSSSSSSKCFTIPNTCIQTSSFFSSQRRWYSSTHNHDYSSDHYKDRFRPSRSVAYSKPDERQYNYAPDYRTRNQSSPALKSNSYEGSRTYGRSDYRRSFGGSEGRDWPSRSISELGSRLKPINWDTETLIEFQKNFYKERPEVAARTVEQIKRILKEQQISIDGHPPIPKPIMTFEEAGFPSYIEQEINNAQLIEPTPIQKIGLPIALSGRDFIGVSQTGSGKTLAFILPALIHIDAQPPLRQSEGPIALILAPTRELACQIHREAANFGNARQIRCTALYGGSPRGVQESQLIRGSEIVIGCPGRLLDFLENQVTNLKRTTYLVLDEADRMLDMGFEPQIRKIVSQIRPDRQTLMYSATWPASVTGLARDFCKEEPVSVKIGSIELHANPDVSQQIMIVNSHEKEYEFNNWISTTLTSSHSGSKPRVLVFCSTRNLCDRLTHDLIAGGKPAIAIHGQKSQRDRDAAIEDFKSGVRQVLVATDVAARGLDINDVTAVVNYDLPSTIEDYVHRIGRTGRAGKKGVALTLFPRDERSSDSFRMAHSISLIMRQAGQHPPDELIRLSGYKK